MVNSNSFPQPLSKGGGEVFKIICKGNKEAKDILIEHNLRLVAHIVKI